MDSIMFTLFDDSDKNLEAKLRATSGKAISQIGFNGAVRKTDTDLVGAIGIFHE